MLSLEATHFSVTVVPAALPCRPVGVVGDWVSATHCGTATGKVALACETLPAASRPFTYSPQLTPGVSGNDVLVVLPATEVINWPSW
jgi:hypothetical protein